ncbi:phospholipid scramblase 1 isoform X1 [Denticeps clupeoides]|uniref:phospholipid scramblase 1 isoform X1 n=1 Tax=Denticeps clupeoides TaxID=299321 RepID=UPI0010A584BC|nr:phospholipid scramblase 1-like isoform X1 [Denticeps clupeoides]
MHRAYEQVLDVPEIDPCSWFQIDQVLIHQKIELLETLIGFETNNQYEVKNSMGQKIFDAKEQTDCCTRNCCGPLRCFDIKITDHNGQEVVRLARPLRCSSCCCPCCLQELEVQSPPGTTIGYVCQNWHPFLPKFSVLGASKETLLKVEGPLCAISCCGDVDFEVKSKDDRVIGRITKQWSGLVKEAFTDSDNFGIQFPMDLDVKVKAVLLGACFLIDFMFFEQTGDSGQRCSVFG